MVPIGKLLARIRWDAAFGRAEFELGYWDRVSRTIVRVPLRDVRQEGGAFMIEDDRGVPRRIPLHRVRLVVRDGVSIWQRASPPTERRPETLREYGAQKPGIARMRKTKGLT